MDNKKEIKTINEYIELFDKHIEKGDEEKAREYIVKAMEANNKIFEDGKKEILSTMEKAGLSTEELLNELENIK